MSHRKIDVDYFDEDRLNEEDLYEADPRSPAEIEQATNTRISEVKSLLTRYESRY